MLVAHTVPVVLMNAILRVLLGLIENGLSLIEFLPVLTRIYGEN